MWTPPYCSWKHLYLLGLDKNAESLPYNHPACVTVKHKPRDPFKVLPIYNYSPVLRALLTEGKTGGHITYHNASGCVSAVNILWERFSTSPILLLKFKSWILSFEIDHVSCYFRKQFRKNYNGFNNILQLSFKDFMQI